MAGRGLLIDNDAFILLAGCGLVQATIQVLEVDQERVFRLDALPYMLNRSKRLRKAHSEDTIVRATVECGRCKALQERPDDAVMERLTASPNVDDGEALLLATMVERDDLLLLSGDKRAMIGFANAPGLDDLRQRAEGRIVCLEKLLLLIAGQIGIAQLIERVGPVTESSITLQIVFSTANRSDPQRCLDGLNSYLTDLGAQVGDGLLFP